MSIPSRYNTNVFLPPTSNRRIRHRGFFTLIGLLIVVAVMLTMYSMQFSSTVPMALEFAEDGEVNNQENMKPWHELDRIGNDHYLGDNQPERDDMLVYQGVRLTDEASDEHRGKIYLSIDTEGNIISSWFGSYYSDDKEYDIQMGKIQGSTDPSLIYKNKQGDPDDTKLFFIGGGHFALMKYQQSRAQIVKGNLYITGWLNKDLSIEGKVHLSQDLKDQTIFTFRANPPTY